jgi:SAM-dependent methyltransferase
VPVKTQDDLRGAVILRANSVPRPEGSHRSLTGNQGTAGWPLARCGDIKAVSYHVDAMDASAESTYARFADFYDAYVAEYAADLPFHLALAARAEDPILEVGAGTGRVLLPLLDAGHRVTGVDVSEAILAKARRKLVGRGHHGRSTLLLHDLAQAPLAGRFGLALVTFFTFNYLLDAVAQRAMLANIAACLRDQGQIALHLFYPAALDPAVAGRWVEKGPLSVAGERLMLSDRRVMVADRIEERTQVFTLENGRRETIRTSRRYSTPAEIAALLGGASFECLGMTETLTLADLAPVRADVTRDFMILARKTG